MWHKVVFDIPIRYKQTSLGTGHLWDTSAQLISPAEKQDINGSAGVPHSCCLSAISIWALLGTSAWHYMVQMK